MGGDDQSIGSVSASVGSGMAKIDVGDTVADRVGAAGNRACAAGVEIGRSMLCVDGADMGAVGPRVGSAPQDTLDDCWSDPLPHAVSAVKNVMSRYVKRE